MRAFRLFAIAAAYCIFVIALCLINRPNLVGTLLGMALFGASALGAWTIRERGVCPRTMLAAALISGLGVLAFLWPDPWPGYYSIPVRGAHWPYEFGPLHLFYLRLLLVSGAVAPLWVGLLSLPRFTGWQRRIRQLTVCCVFLSATLPLAALYLDWTNRFGMGEIVLVALCATGLGALSVSGSISVALFSLAQRKEPVKGLKAVGHDVGVGLDLFLRDLRTLFPFQLMAALPLASLAPIWTGLLDLEGFVRNTGPFMYRILASMVVVIIGAMGVIALFLQAAQGRKMAGAPKRLRRGLVPILVLILLVTGANIFGVNLGLGMGPTYEGKRASKWIELLGRSYLPNETFRKSDRRKPVEALLSIGPTAVPVAMDMLWDKQWEVRTGAAAALALWGTDSSPAAVYLIPAIEDENRYVREAAIEALASIGPADGVSVVLVHQLAYVEPRVRVDVAYAILLLAPDNEPAMRTLIDSIDPLSYETQGSTSLTDVSTSDVRTRACWVLQEIGPPAKAAVPTLVDALKDKDDKVRGAATRALAAVDPETAKQVAAIP